MVEIKAHRMWRIGGYGNSCATQVSAVRARLGVAWSFDGLLGPAALLDSDAWCSLVRPMRYSRFASLLLFLSALALTGCEVSPPPEEQLNIVLISIDTLRADRLGIYGYERDTSPNLDAFGARGAVFERAVAESSWTIPSHVTMLTGLTPESHGVVIPPLKIAADVPLLAEILRSEGYNTFGSSDGGHMSERHGFGRGFQVYDSRHKGFSAAFAEARKWVGKLADGNPFFLFLHAYNVHCPYHPEESLARQFRSSEAEYIETRGRCGNPYFNSMELTPGQVRLLSDNYDASIRETDGIIGDFLNWLASNGHGENTVVIITSDHGEEFFEHGRIGHEGTVYREALMIPFLVAGRGVQPARHKLPVGLTEIAPTILELAGIKALHPMDGTSLTTLLHGGAAPTMPAERHSQVRWQGRLKSVISGDWHLIVNQTTGALELYSLSNDPQEHANLAGTRPREVAELLDLIRQHARRRAPNPTPIGKLPPEALEQLRALGYTK